MFLIYDILIRLTGKLIGIASAFSPKLRLFVQGRKSVLEDLREKISPSDKTLWFHAASLGEYEQGLPVMEKMKERYPDHKLVLTFFSPSGYEVRKNNAIADVTVYLPLDTRSNAKQFLDIVHPEMVFLIKYEFWPNYLRELKERRTRTFLISGIFRPDQVFFKPYGGFYRRALNAIEHFFVQNSTSKELLARLGKYNVTVSGDTRFDRVATILEKDNSLDFIEEFLDSKTSVVIGSSWPADEKLLAEYINRSAPEIKFIFAPHNIKPQQITDLKNQLKTSVVLFSEKDQKSLADFQVLIVDTIGILTKIYSYADIAYVGGGFGNPGVHNILEPATFGIPVVIGPNYSHFAEATALVTMAGCVSISNQQELNEQLDLLIQNEDERYEKGHICRTFVEMNQGATTTILNYFDR